MTEYDIPLPDVSTPQIDGILNDLVENISMMPYQEQAMFSEILLTFAVRVMRISHGDDFTDATIDMLKDIK